MHLDTYVKVYFIKMAKTRVCSQYLLLTIGSHFISIMFNRTANYDSPYNLFRYAPIIEKKN